MDRQRVIPQISEKYLILLSHRKNLKGNLALIYFFLKPWNNMTYKIFLTMLHRISYTIEKSLVMDTFPGEWVPRREER